MLGFGIICRGVGWLTLRVREMTIRAAGYTMLLLSLLAEYRAKRFISGASKRPPPSPCTHTGSNWSSGLAIPRKRGRGGEERGQEGWGERGYERECEYIVTDPWGRGEGESLVTRVGLGSIYM